MTILGTEDYESNYNGVVYNGVTYYISADDTHQYWIDFNNTENDPVEIELPLVLAHLPGRGTTPNAVTHVIVDLSFIHPCSKITILPVRRASPLALDHIRFLGNQMIHCNTFQSF